MRSSPTGIAMKLRAQTISRSPADIDSVLRYTLQNNFLELSFETLTSTDCMPWVPGLRIYRAMYISAIRIITLPSIRPFALSTLKSDYQRAVNSFSSFCGCSQVSARATASRSRALHCSSGHLFSKIDILPRLSFAIETKIIQYSGPTSEALVSFSYDSRERNLVFALTAPFSGASGVWQSPLAVSAIFAKIAPICRVLRMQSHCTDWHSVDLPTPL